MKYLAAVGAFILVVLVVAWLFWAGGYNFDTRGVDLVMLSFLSLWCGGWVAWGVAITWKERNEKENTN